MKELEEHLAQSKKQNARQSGRLVKCCAEKKAQEAEIEGLKDKVKVIQ